MGVVIVLLFLMISEYVSQVVQFFKYADEIVAVLFVLRFLGKFLTRYKVVADSRKSLFMIFVLVIIGIVGNLYSAVQTNFTAIALDIVSNFKLFICFYGTYDLVRDGEKAEYILGCFSRISRIFLTVGAICAIVSLFTDIGMRGQARFGIYGFNFIYDYAHIYSIMILVAIMIVMHSDSKHKYAYIFMAIIQMILTTKGPSIIWAVGILVLIYYMKFHRKIGAFAILGVGFLGLAFGSYQIQNYLLNESAPRFWFYKYGFITATKYIPLGAGFATFGSDMAAKFYSPLYVAYGIANRWGMSADDSRFLRDNYWPMIMGQFGFIGLILFAVMLYKIFCLIQKRTLKPMDKAMTLSAFLYLMVHSIGSSTPTTSAAVTMMMFVALILRTGVEVKKHYV